MFNSDISIWWIAGVSLGAVALVALLAYLQWRSWGQGRTSLASHLDSRLAERIAEAQQRLTAAKLDLQAKQDALSRATTAAGTDDPASQAAFRQAEQQLTESRQTVEFEEAQLRHLLHGEPSQGFLAETNLGMVVQYAIFATLAWFVLHHLMQGLTNSPPAGSTPRTMITFLIAVVTVGIALILVLATIVSNSEDRDKRFSQGKEVLTALLGVLGTIVGFYFGTAQDHEVSFRFAPVVISKGANDTVTISTSVLGGKAPYSGEITFTPSDIKPVPIDSKNGEIKATAALPPGTDEKEVSFVIRVRDSEGRVGTSEHAEAFQFEAGTAPGDSKGKASSDKSDPKPAKNRANPG